jgi:hypothetical protein
MKNFTCSIVKAAGIAMACWLLPSLGWASVEVNGVYYDLDEADQTAVVVANPDKYVGTVNIPGDITVDGKTYLVTAIADCAFIDNYDLEQVYMESSNLTKIGFSAFERCYSLNSVTLPEGLKFFNYEAFKDCRSLERVQLPSTLEHIGGRSFMNCVSLTKINVPESAAYLGNKWLYDCPLIVLVADSQEPLKLKEDPFEGLDKDACILSVPEGCKEAYQAAKVWKDFLIFENYDEGGTTAIESISDQSPVSRQIFDLQGRRLNNASRHSIIIENGRKRIEW